MIELRQIGFAFADTTVLRGVDMSMKAGELTAIVGPNGAGKSTLLRIVAGLLAPSQGTARVLELDPYAGDRQALARRLAYLSQSYRMVFPFTALEVVLMGRYAHTQRGRWGRDSEQDRELAMSALGQCDVQDLADRRIDQLSGGEKRRVLIAQALCQEAELLLLDEPTAGLDPKHARDLFEMVRGQCDGARSCLLVTHDLNLATRYADRLLLLDQGEQRALGTAGEVLASPALQQAFDMKLQQGTLPDGHTPYVVPY